MQRNVIVIMGILLLLAGCQSLESSIPGYYGRLSAKNYRAIGSASWYGKRFHARKTASGERYNMYALTAAHKTLPLHSLVRVTNLSNGRQVVVVINDRGPFSRGRLIDLSYGAANKLGMLPKGTAQVEVIALRSG